MTIPNSHVNVKGWRAKERYDVAQMWIQRLNFQRINFIVVAFRLLIDSYNRIFSPLDVSSPIWGESGISAIILTEYSDISR